MNMRTNIVLDDKLVRAAMKATGAKTKREVVDLALRGLIQTKAQKNILELVGRNLIDPDYDVRAVRAGKAHGPGR
jgi:Arc/MetJ family transcription regulator